MKATVRSFFLAMYVAVLVIAAICVCLFDHVRSRLLRTIRRDSKRAGAASLGRGDSLHEQPAEISGRRAVQPSKRRAIQPVLSLRPSRKSSDDKLLTVRVQQRADLEGATQ